MKKSLLASSFASALHARDVAEDDGGLIAYAERVAKKREGSKALPMHHLAPLARSYEAVELAIRGEGPPIFECHHAPVQHAKTSLIQAFFLRTLRRNPKVKLAYPSFSAERAESKMYEVRQLCEWAGIHIDPNFDTSAEFRTREGGSIKAGGLVGGPWTGEGYGAIVPDDPYKNQHEAYSASWRARVEGEFEASLLTRRAPWTSIVVNHARWHPLDLIGSLIRKGWRYKRLAAINEHEEALWPERWPVFELFKIRDGAPAEGDRPGRSPVSRATWLALYQGTPQDAGSRIFDPAHLATYDQLPEGAYTEAIGIDIAYGARARHDQSALVVWRRYTADPRALYLVEPWIGHEPVELFACRAAEVQLRRGAGLRLMLPRDAADIERPGPDGWRGQLAREEVRIARRLAARWYTSTTEAGTAALMAGYGARVEAVRAAVDKLARAQAGGYTAAWAEGRIRWPARGGQHVDAVRVQHEDFTGADGDADDGVDAAVAGHDLLAIPGVGLELGPGRAVGAGADEWQAPEVEHAEVRRWTGGGGVSEWE